MAETFHHNRLRLEVLEERDCPSLFPAPMGPYVEMVRDLNPGAPSSNPVDLTAVPSGVQNQPAKRFFFADGKDAQDNNIVKLWMSNGTSDGTKEIASFNYVNNQKPIFNSFGEHRSIRRQGQEW